NVWICWWQGYDNMPDLCKACYESVKKYMPSNVKVNLITKYNYYEFMDIPEYIINRLDNEELTITQFSDWIRNYLLNAYGGFWIDSTILVTKPILNEFLYNRDFWSVKLPEEKINEFYIGQKVSKCKWSGFIMKSAPNNPINYFALEALSNHIRLHSNVIDYFIHNFLIRLGYENCKVIRKEIDKIEINNVGIYDLSQYMNIKYDEKIWDNLTNNTSFFKLSWKEKYIEQDDNGNLTFYGYILKMLEGNINND
ncbi:MAG: capsular polysaccharide synthesis protein, partial [Methanobacteriaceae archaeon]|nr:capsular polysaccharide synthesis protein [Methanobacteriaceae archaeon]